MRQAARLARAFAFLAAMWSPLLSLAQVPSPAGIPVVPITMTNGVKVGEGRLHGFFEYEGRFDSAAGFFGVNSAGTLTLAPEFVSHFRPGLRFELPASWVDIYLAGYVDYVWYTGAITPGSQIASRVEADADLEVGFNRNGQVGVEVGDSVMRSDRPRTPSIGVGVLSLFNEAHVAMPIRPGGGALEITPKGTYSIELFQPISGQPAPGCADLSCDPTAVSSLNYQNIQGAVQAKWRFLPKTAVLIDTTYDARSYFSAAAVSPRANLFRVTGGLAGLLTSRLSAVVKAGWGKDFGVSNGAAFLAQAELAYYLSETASIRGGYVRDIQPTPLYGSYRNDRVYLDVRALLGGAFTLRGYGAYDWLAFFNDSNRLDQSVMVDVGPQYQVTPWFLVGAGYVFSTRRSNQNTAASFNFTRHEAYVRLTLTY